MLRTLANEATHVALAHAPVIPRPRPAVPLPPTPPEPDLVGRLKAFSFSDLLQLLSLGGQTGTLTLSEGWNTRTLSFERGRLAYISAATRLPSVGQLLLASGRIDRLALDAAIAAHTATGIEVADALIASGAVEEADLRRCRDQQLEETIYSLFLWRNCIFSFTSGQAERDEGGLAVDMASERLILDGTRRVDEWISISPSVPSVRLIFLPHGGRKAEGVDCEILALLDGRRDVGAVASAAGMTQFDVACALHRLVQAGRARAIAPDKVKIVELFSFLVESIHMKLMMFGHSADALMFERELNRFAGENGLKVRMRGGKTALSDIDSPTPSTALIDLYRLFIAIQNNHFARRLHPEVVHGLVQGLYLHVDRDLQEMLLMYEFVQPEGLLRVA